MFPDKRKLYKYQDLTDEQAEILEQAVGWRFEYPCEGFDDWVSRDCNDSCMCCVHNAEYERVRWIGVKP